MTSSSSSSSSSSPSTSAQALAPVGPQQLRALKTSLDELDDDDLLFLGQVVSGRTPTRLRKMVGIGLGVLASFGLVVAGTPLGGLGLIVGVAVLTVVGGRKDIVADLAELELSPALAEQVRRGINLRSSATISSNTSLDSAMTAAHFRLLGAAVVDEARRQARS